MNSLAVRFSKLLRISPASSIVVSAERGSKSWFSTGSSDTDNNEGKDDHVDEDFEESIPEKPQLQPQGVDPRRGWGFRGVHRAIICGKVGQAPLQKILRNGRTVTVFTVGTGGMFDQRLLGMEDKPKPAQWHRIAVHNEVLSTYAVQKLTKNASVYVEGDIETRMYNDSISGEVKNVPEICVRNDGRIRLIKSGESLSKISFDDLKEGLLQ